jgi:SSU ribosomal protein S3P
MGLMASAQQRRLPMYKRIIDENKRKWMIKEYLNIALTRNRYVDSIIQRTTLGTRVIVIAERKNRIIGGDPLESTCRHASLVWQFVYNDLPHFKLGSNKNEVHRLRGLALSPSEVAQVVRGGDPLMIGSLFLLGPLSSLIGDRVSRGFSNAELVYLQELRNMGKIEDVSPEGKYIIQDIYFVRGLGVASLREFLRRLRPYRPKGHRA